MLLLCLLLAHFTLGTSFLENLCYGSTYQFYPHFTPAVYNKTIIYTPKVGEPKIVVNNGQSLDSRFKVLRTKIEMANLCERDNEATLTIGAGYFNTVTLRVKNCRSIVKKLCGSFIKWQIPYDAEYLEFSGPDVLAPPAILWNRTSRSSIRGEVSGSDYEIKALTQRDSGYYRFRSSKDELLKWDQIVVDEHVRSYEYDEGKIKIEYPVVFTPAQVKFTRVWASKTETLSKSDSRFKITSTYLIIEYATPEDSGTYDFLDKDGNRILHVTLEVKEVEKVWVSLVVLAVISCGFIICCCCVAKYCCKDSSNKANGPESETEAPPPSLHHNGTQTQTETVTPLLSQEPRITFPDPPTYNEAGGYTDPPPPYEKCVTQPSAPPVPNDSSLSDNASAEPAVNLTEQTERNNAANDAVIADESIPDQVSTADAMTFSINMDPHFEVCGTALSSFPTQNSDEPNASQYNSDKLNFI